MLENHLPLFCFGDCQWESGNQIDWEAAVARFGLGRKTSDFSDEHSVPLVKIPVGPPKHFYFLQERKQLTELGHFPYTLD